jgi:predicted nuclease of predicted toxin-antitoxin system
MRVLLDECVPIALRSLLRATSIETAEFRGWKGWINGRLLRAAAEAGFDIVVTSDQEMYGHANVAALGIALVVLPTNRLTVLKTVIGSIQAAIDAARPGSILHVDADTAR